MENNNKETLFLAKLELMINKMDELDSISNDITVMLEELPKLQQNIDYELSDYYHKMEEPDTTDIEFVNIGKKIQECRRIRNDLNCLYNLKKAYDENKNKLFWSPSHNREEFRKSIKYARKYLHEDYKYRVLTEEDMKSFKKQPKEKVITIKKGKITKEQLEECLASGMRNKDIAKAFGVDDSYISKLKAAYGLGTRSYRKRG